MLFENLYIDICIPAGCIKIDLNSFMFLSQMSLTVFTFSFKTFFRIVNKKSPFPVFILNTKLEHQSVNVNISEVNLVSIL